MSLEAATAQSTGPQTSDSAVMLIPYPRMVLSTGILVCIQCDKSGEAVFQQAAMLRQELSASSAEELYGVPSIIHKEFQRHSWYLWDQYDKVEITDDPGKGILGDGR